MNVYSIAWKTESTNATYYNVSVVSLGPRARTDEIEWPVCFEQSFQYPKKYGWEPSLRGASETLGLFGGVQNSEQEGVSECVERNIADLETMCLANLLESRPITDWHAQDGSLLLLAGPVLPKAVGRFASLRPPRSLHIGWLSPPKPFTWLQGVPAQYLLTGPKSVQMPDKPWEDEALVIDLPFEQDGNKYCFHYLDLYRRRVVPNSVIEAIREMHERPWMSTAVPTCFQICGLLFLSSPMAFINPYAAPIDFVASITSMRAFKDKLMLMNTVKERFSNPAKRKNLTEDEMEELLELLTNAW